MEAIHCIAWRIQVGDPRTKCNAQNYGIDIKYAFGKAVQVLTNIVRMQTSSVHST